MNKRIKIDDRKAHTIRQSEIIMNTIYHLRFEASIEQSERYSWFDCDKDHDETKDSDGWTINKDGMKMLIRRITSYYANEEELQDELYRENYGDLIKLNEKAREVKLNKLVSKYKKDYKGCVNFLLGVLHNMLMSDKEYVRLTN